eukprot:5703640-Alexandrium_andersonii.AAC.1
MSNCVEPARQTTGARDDAVAEGHAEAQHSGAARYPLRGGRKCQEQRHARVRPPNLPTGGGGG